MASMGRALDDLIEHLFHAQLAVDDEVGTSPAGLGEHLAGLVRQQANRLGPTRIYADDVTQEINPPPDRS